MLPEQLQRLIGYFIEEGQDHLNTIEQGLLHLQSTIEDPEIVDELFHAAHSLRGGAAMLELHNIQKTAHHLRECFNSLRIYPVRVDQELESSLQRVVNTLKQLLLQLSGPWGLPEEVSNSMMLAMEPVFEELHAHLGLLVNQAGRISTNLTIRATTGTERIYLSGYCTLQAIEPVVRRFGGAITRRNWEQSPDERPSIEIDIRLPALSALEVFRSAIHSAGGTIETVQIDHLPARRQICRILERFQTCRGCRYYYGQADGGNLLVCAIHPNGPEEDECRDWEGRK